MKSNPDSNIIIPSIPSEGFLEFCVDRRKQVVVAHSEGLNPRVWLGLLIGMLTIIPISVFLFGAYHVVAEAKDNCVGLFAALNFVAFLAGFVGVCWVRPAIKTGWGRVELCIYKDDLTVTTHGWFAPTSQTFPLGKILRTTSVSHLQPDIWCHLPTYDFPIVHRLLPEDARDHPVFCYPVEIISGRNSKDTAWIKDWIDTNIDAIRENRDVGIASGIYQKANGPQHVNEEVFI